MSDESPAAVPAVMGASLGGLWADDDILESEGHGLDVEWIPGAGAATFDARTRTIHPARGRNVTSDGAIIATVPVAARSFEERALEERAYRCL
ncbi:hypothetical protein ACIQC5_08765 [Paenarthrobacter sp. NPDC092416]|uniref:hypothetical protein n=1 Tax=Paenarthrobacter sp. NPDC092416 TaxID=3364386 RepID=UPI0038120947